MGFTEFLTKEHSAGQAPVEETQPPVENVAEEVQEEVVQEEVISTPPVVEQPTEQAVVEEQQTPTKKKLDLSEYVEQNKDIIARYVTEKDKDYKALDDVEAIKLKIKQDNPTWNDNDIKDELEDKYSVGLEKKVIDKDEMTPEEIKEAENYNKIIDKGVRLLKADAKLAKDFLNENKGDFTLPEFEIEGENPEEIIKSYTETLQKQTLEYIENTWKPTLVGELNKVESLKISYNIEDNGGVEPIELDYKLSEKEKTDLVNDLLYRQTKESDSKYVKPNGDIDYQSFFNDEGKRLFQEKITIALLKQARAEARKSIVKSELLNHDDGVHTNPTEVNELTTDQKLFKAFKRN